MKNVIAIMLGLFLSAGALAQTETAGPEFSGQVSLQSDRLMRGMTMNSGLTAGAGVQLDWNGAKAGLNVHQNDQNGDAKMLADMFAGYNMGLGDFQIGLEYHNYSFRDDWDNKLSDFEEVQATLRHEWGYARHHSGLDDAPDYWEVGTGALKYVNVWYGDWEDTGSNYGVSADLGNHLGGDIAVGWTWFDADSASDMEDDDTMWVSYTVAF
jgi:hypothetical protein